MEVKSGVRRGSISGDTYSLERLLRDAVVGAERQNAGAQTGTEKLATAKRVRVYEGLLREMDAQSAVREQEARERGL